MIRTRRFVLTLVLLAAAVCASRLAVFAYTTFSAWASPSVVVYVNPQNLDVSSDAAETALQAAMDAWTHAGSAFRYTYGGRVADTTMTLDGRSVAIFRNASSGSAIATTYSWTSGSTLVDADIVFWDGGFTFFTGTSGCAGSGGVYLEDVATHELGHVLGLGHSTDPNATMYPSYSLCSQGPRTLADDDIAGVRGLYAPVNTPPTVTITSPVSGASFVYGTAIAFVGSASDAEDGTLTDRMTWVSNIDGNLGSGGFVSRALSVGTHDIAASVTDNLGSTSSRRVTVTVTPVTVPGGATATFAGTDTATRGNWKGAYGAQGYTIANDSAVLPAFAAVTPGGGATYTWAGSTSDARALLKSSSTSDRIASTWYGNFDTQVTVADTVTHKVSLYLVDYDRAGRAETIDLLDAASGALLDRRAVSNFSNGVYLSWDVRGSIVVRLRLDAGANAVYSAVFVDATAAPPPPPPAGASASFLGADLTTQGNWQGAYGGQGYTIANDSTSLPAFATVTAVGGATYTWAASTFDVRALLKSASTDRIASTWYTDFDTGIVFTDTAVHKVSLYLVDYDRDGRAQTIDLLDAATGALLDRRAVSNFSNGVYLSWNVTGAIVVRLRVDAGSNAVYSGLFLD